MKRKRRKNNPRSNKEVFLNNAQPDFSNPFPKRRPGRPKFVGPFVNRINGLSTIRGVLVRGVEGKVFIPDDNSQEVVRL